MELPCRSTAFAETFGIGALDIGENKVFNESVLNLPNKTELRSVSLTGHKLFPSDEGTF